MESSSLFDRISHMLPGVISILLTDEHLTYHSHFFLAFFENPAV
jgi:hypothetical protein